MTTTELNLVKRMMPEYSNYLQKNPDSLLCKILGIFTVNAELFRNVHIMLMENTVRLKDPKQLKYVFDLKGSTVDRVVNGKTTKDTTLKDVNFIVTKQKFKTLTSLDGFDMRRLNFSMR